MKWIYYFRRDWSDNLRTPVQRIYLRPTMENEDKELMVGKIAQITILAMNFYFEKEDNPLKKYEEIRRIYFEKPDNKDYHIVDKEVTEEEDYLLINTEIFLHQEDFDKEEFFDWIDKIFIMKGYEKSEMKETSNNDFLELNPIMRLFSVENAKKFEDKFGKDWWKE